MAWGSPGCHSFASIIEQPERHIVSMTQLGGEGLPWIGLGPYTDRPHLVQNVGDGSLFHSSFLNIRFCVAAGANMTGAIALTAYDMFPSITANPNVDFILFDNVAVYAGLVPIGGPGDYDNSVAVDGKDFLRWQRGATPDLGSAAEFDVWKTNFGGGAVTAISAAAPVPESAALSYALLGGALAMIRRRSTTR